MIKVEKKERTNKKMADVLTTVIMRTDIRESTVRTRMLTTSKLSLLLREHKHLILDIALKHGGNLVKGTGDGFLITFPSVTTASLAALTMQEHLRTSQVGKADNDRLAIRIVITLGDVLYQEGDIFGDAVNLAARIETVTPADEIYMSHSAWLALSKAEIQTIFVNDFDLESFSEPARVFRINQEYRSQIIMDHVIAVTDLKGYGHFIESSCMKDSEEMVVFYANLHTRIGEEFGGTIRQLNGDKVLMTFSNAYKAVTGLSHLCLEWSKFIIDKGFSVSMPITIAIHRGDFCIFQSIIYGPELNTTFRISRVPHQASQREKSRLLVSGKVKSDLAGTEWENQLKAIKLSKEEILAQRGIDVYELEI